MEPIFTKCECTTSNSSPRGKIDTRSLLRKIRSFPLSLSLSLSTSASLFTCGKANRSRGHCVIHVINDCLMSSVLSKQIEIMVPKTVARRWSLQTFPLRFALPFLLHKMTRAMKGKEVKLWSERERLLRCHIVTECTTKRAVPIFFFPNAESPEWSGGCASKML